MSFLLMCLKWHPLLLRHFLSGNKIIIYACVVVGVVSVMEFFFLCLGFGFEKCHTLLISHF
jgi:hypothetical protein